ncbi:hypothetical protein [Tessaracoccus caeni]|uniref:hypothetical protein n=1 Tax=Tessaracoccus caeni TaxID=3031239 RepID=UPI0023DCD65A|nr:hypothetical protein [Tessaracoccus caeni]MDF1489699.1 hypothetical protein [Tessaracoccus caeni]
MTNTQVTLGLIAIFIGVAIGVILFVPFVMVSYRRRGHLSFARWMLCYGGSPLPTVLARLLRWAGGVAGLSALGIPEGAFNLVSIALFVLACVLPFFTANGRGLPGLISGQGLHDARE